jgi:hypothetical protein
MNYSRKQAEKIKIYTYIVSHTMTYSITITELIELVISQNVGDKQMAKDIFIHLVCLHMQINQLFTDGTSW